MKGAAQLTGRYSAALMDYLRDRDESALQEAYEVGRQEKMFSGRIIGTTPEYADVNKAIESGQPWIPPESPTPEGQARDANAEDI